MHTQNQGTAKRRTTMVDVARAAGVSQSTVSFVINDRRDIVIGEETRRRVLEVAAELDFRPNRTARALRMNQSFLVGIVTHGIVAAPYNGKIVLGIQKAVQAHGLLCMVVETSEDPAEGDEAVASFLAQGVHAIVYASNIPREMHTSPLLGDTRCLFVNCWPADAAIAETVVLADEYGGGRLAAQSAFAAGHTDVAFLGGLPDEYACVERHRAFEDVAREAGIDPSTLFQTYGDYGILSGHDATLRAFRHGRPTALVCGNDRMALGALLALHKLGLEVPGDVSIVGFDDQPEVADQLRPALTTVALPHDEMGRRAGQLLTAPAADSPARISVPCPMVTRDSLGPVPRRP